MKFLILFALLLLTQYSFAEYTVSTYYTTSDCSGSPVYFVAESSSNCLSTNCIQDGKNSNITSCSSNIPSVPAGLISAFGFFDNSCSGDPLIVAGFPTECTFNPSINEYNYATCSGSNATFYSNCTSSSCAGCTGFTYSTSCTSLSGESIRAQCATSSTLTASLSLVAIEVLAVFAALRRY